MKYLEIEHKNILYSKFSSAVNSSDILNSIKAAMFDKIRLIFQNS